MIGKDGKEDDLYPGHLELRTNTHPIASQIIPLLATKFGRYSKGYVLASIFFEFLDSKQSHV